GRLPKNDVIEKHNIVLNTALSTNISDRSQVLELKSLSEIEKDHIEAILNRVNWNKVEASRILGITRPTLNSKIEKYNLAR
ncbi:MAG: helix-turn-helix domain-containing protein, partial [Bacteroidales bacterium]